MARKKAMATNGDTTGNDYHCPLSSAAVAAAVGKDSKGSCGLFLYGVVVKTIGLCVFSILIFGKEAISLKLDSLIKPYYCNLHRLQVCRRLLSNSTLLMFLPWTEPKHL